MFVYIITSPTHMMHTGCHRFSMVSLVTKHQLALSQTLDSTPLQWIKVPTTTTHYFIYKCEFSFKSKLNTSIYLPSSSSSFFNPAYLWPLWQPWGTFPRVPCAREQRTCGPFSPSWQDLMVTNPLHAYFLTLTCQQHNLDPPSSLYLFKGRDDYQQEISLGDPSAVDIKDVTILWGDPAYRLTLPVSEEMKQAQRKCVDYFASLGAKDVQKIDMKVERTYLNFKRPFEPPPPTIQNGCSLFELHFFIFFIFLHQDFRNGFSIWAAMLDEAGGPTFSELMGNGKPIRASVELAKWLVQNSHNHHHNKEEEDDDLFLLSLLSVSSLISILGLTGRHQLRVHPAGDRVGSHRGAAQAHARTQPAPGEPRPQAEGPSRRDAENERGAHSAVVFIDCPKTPPAPSATYKLGSSLSLFLVLFLCSVHWHMHMHMHTYTYTYTYTFLHIYIYTYIRKNIFTHTYTHAHTYTKTKTYAHTHIYTHAHGNTYIHIKTRYILRCGTWWKCRWQLAPWVWIEMDCLW